jgi:uncharacterized repeat protein (TIGR01451 family)
MVGRRVGVLAVLSLVVPLVFAAGGARASEHLLVKASKSASPSLLAPPGGSVTYTVGATNLSAVPVTILGITDDVYGDVPSIPGSTCAALVQTVLAPNGGTASCTFPATFTGEAGDSVTDIVTVTVMASDESMTTGSATATVRIVQPADLSVSKSCDEGQVAPGAYLLCAVTVTNHGPGAAEGIVVTDDLDPGLTSDDTQGGDGFLCGTGDPFECTLASLAPGTSATFTYGVRVTPDAGPGAAFQNVATVSATTPDADLDDNTATATISVVSCGITGAGAILGTDGPDVICGSAGPDRIAALGGDDVVFGFGGDDQISGGDGEDVLIGGPGVDRLAGGPGDDVLDTADLGGTDYVAGGDHASGDACRVDAADTVAGCEF